MPPLLATVVDFHADPSGEVLLSWADAPGLDDRRVPRAEIARLEQLAGALGLAEDRGRGAAVVEARAALSAALFALLDGPDRALRERLNVAEIAARRFDLVVRATTDGALGGHPAAWMRWELLPLAAPMTVVLQLGPPDLGPPRVLDRGGLRILFMAFSPHDAPPELDFEHEEEALLAALAPLVEARRARMRVVEEGTLDELRAALAADRFDVVHLSGHGCVTPEGARLVMEDAFGARRMVSPAELMAVLGGTEAMPELVMLSTCHSAEVRGSAASFAAELVGAGLPNVLGWTRSVRDDQATLAASTVYAALGAGKTPVEAAEAAREAMRRSEERSPAPTGAWATLHLVSSAAGGFRVDAGAAPLDGEVDRDEVYTYLRGRMRVLAKGFVGRRRLLQRLLRALLRGQEARPEGVRQVAGACVFGMKGVGKSCAVGRAIERAKQVAPGLRVVVVHGAIEEHAVLGAFQEASGGDEVADRLLADKDEPLLRRVRRVMDRWRDREVAIVLDDFEQNLERRTDGPWRVTDEAAALLGAILPVCAAGKPKVLITSTAAFEVPDGQEGVLAFVPLGAFDAAAIQKLWMRGQASKELWSVSLRSWQRIAERLGRNARILTWARALCAGKADGEMVEVAARATAELPVWEAGDEAREEKQGELARLFLKHMAYEEARAAVGEDALTFLKRARVFEAAVPKAAFWAMAGGLAVDLDRDMDVLASWGLLEVGEMDGARAYRVSPLVEPRFEVPDAVRWHEAASAVWEALFRKAANAEVQLERCQAGWEHAIFARSAERADPLAIELRNMLDNASLYADSLRLAERHVRVLPESPVGHVWAGRAETRAGRPGPNSVDHVQRGLLLVIRATGTEEHLDVASVLGTLQEVLASRGDFAGARHAIERSLAIQAKVLGTEDHPNVARSLDDLAAVLRIQGDLAGARRAIERSLAIGAKVYGTEEHYAFAASLMELSSLLRRQGDLAGARRAIERSLALQAKVYGTEEHGNVAAGLYHLGKVLHAQGDLAGARRALERSLAIEIKLLGTEEHLALTHSLEALGDVLRAQGDLEGARKALERSLAINVKVHDTGAYGGIGHHRRVAGKLRDLGQILRGDGDLAGARKALERSLAMMATLGTEEDEVVATSLHELGRVLLAQGDLAGARNALDRSRHLLIKLHGTEEHPHIAWGLYDLGRLLHAQGDLVGARKVLERSHAIHIKVLGTEEHRAVATALHELGLVLLAQGDLAGARRASERSLAIYIKAHGTEDHLDVATSLAGLRSVLMAHGDLAGARRASERSLAIYIKVHGTEDHLDVATSLAGLGRVLEAHGDLAGARNALERWHHIAVKVYGTEEHPEAAAALYELGCVLRAQGDLAGARRASERSLAIYVKVHGTEEHPSVAASLHELGCVLQFQGDLAGARNAFERARHILVKLHGTEAHPDISSALSNLGVVLHKQGDFAGARKALERSRHILVKVHGSEEHPDVARVWRKFGHVLQAQGDLAGAREAEKRARSIEARLRARAAGTH